MLNFELILKKSKLYYVLISKIRTHNKISNHQQIIYEIKRNNSLEIFKSFVSFLATISNTSQKHSFKFEKLQKKNLKRSV